MKNRMTRIALVTNQYMPTFGGVEVHVQTLARNLVEDGFDVYVLTNTLRGGRPTFELQARESADGVQVLRSTTVPLNIGSYWPSFSPGLPISLIKVRPDVVHVHGSFPYFSTVVSIGIARVLGIPCVFTPHYHPARAGKVRIYDKTVLTCLLKQTDRVIAITKSERDYYESLGLSHVVLIPNPTEVVEDNPKDSAAVKEFYGLGDYVLLGVGRLGKGKRFDLAIRALAEASKYFDDVKLVLVGEDAGMEKSLRSLSDQLAVSDKVVFVRKATNRLLNALFSLSSLVVVTSEYEAFGRTIIEAWAHAKAVIAFSNPGSSQAASEGKGISLVMSEQQFQVSIRSLLSDLHRRELMRLEGLENVRSSYEARLVTHQLEAVYSALASRSGVT